MSILLQTHPDGDNAAFRVSKLVFYAQLFGKEKEQKQTNKQTNKQQQQQQQQQQQNKQKKKVGVMKSVAFFLCLNLIYSFKVCSFKG